MIPLRQFLTTGLLIAGVLWAPLPAASVTPLTELVVRLVGLAALIAAAGSWPALGRSKTALTAAAMLLALALLGLAQARPWPAWMARQVSPEHHRLAEQAAAVLEVGSRAGASQVAVDRVYLSLAPEKSRSVALSLSGTAAVFVAALIAGRRRRLRRWLALGVAAAGLTQLVLGARAFAGGDVSRLRGTFVNPDHLAVLLEVSLSVCFAWAAWSVHQSGQRVGAATIERRLVWVGAPLIVWLFLFVGLSFTGSRAGLASALVGVAVQAALLRPAFGRPTGKRRRSGHRRRSVLRAIAILALLSTTLVWIASQAGFGRLLATSRYELLAAERFRVWNESLELVRGFPLLGAGLGSFREAFEQVQPVDLELTWTRAHNDYMELWVTAGLLGLALAAIGIAALALALWRAVARRKRTEDRLAAVAGWGVLVSVGLHEAFDFGATLPATSFVIAVVLGAALSPATSKKLRAVGDSRFRQGTPADRPDRELGVHRRS